MAQLALPALCSCVLKQNHPGQDDGDQWTDASRIPAPIRRSRQPQQLLREDLRQEHSLQAEQIQSQLHRLFEHVERPEAVGSNHGADHKREQTEGEKRHRRNYANH